MTDLITQIRADSAKKDARIAELEAERDRLLEGLDAIKQYGSDTLTGPEEQSDHTREWVREGVAEMCLRADLLIAGCTWNARAALHQKEAET